jgi:hypothetical protein
MINNRMLITTVRWGHFRPSQPARRVTKMGPNQTVTPGPNQTVTATKSSVVEHIIATAQADDPDMVVEQS